MREEFREQDETKRQGLLGFKEKALTGRTAKGWHQRDQLAGQVVRGLQREFQRANRSGWIRADSGPDAKTLGELADLRKQWARSAKSSQLRTTALLANSTG